MRKRTLQGLVLALLAIVLPALSGCAVTDRQVISQAADVHTGLSPAVISDPELTAYIEQVGQRLIAAARDYHNSHPQSQKSTESSDWMFSNDMQFHIVASDTLNAFTTGGNHMYVYTGLLNVSKDEAELAAVMAHEFAHVYARHVQKGMQRQEYSLVGAAAAGAAGYALGQGDSRMQYAAGFAGAAAAVGQFIGMGYTRDDERQADSLGFQFYVRAGYDPQEFADFFKTMIQRGLDGTPEMLSDHPSLASRVTAAEQLAQSLPPEAASWRKPPVASDARFAQLKQRAEQISKTMPPDKTLEGAKLLASAIPNHMLPQQEPQQQQAEARLQQYLQQQQTKPATGR